MTDPTAAFSKLVPGFDFLKGLAANAGAAMPGMGQWIAPTLNPEELEKRIEELRTVQFWLEQNARMIGATIQALEVQRMTLSTLKTMNVSLGDLAESLKIRMPAPAAEPAPPAAQPVRAAPVPTPEPEADGAPSAPPGVVDPMQWWGALTRQFTELASNAMSDGNAEAARTMAGAMVKQGLDSASQTITSAAAMPANLARSAADAASGAARSAAGAAADKAPARAARTPASGAAAKSAAGKPTRRGAG